MSIHSAFVLTVQVSISFTLTERKSRSSSSTGTISIRNPYPLPYEDFTPFEMAGTGLGTSVCRGHLVTGGFWNPTRARCSPYTGKKICCAMI
jgi:hypothetical protein